MLIAGGIAVVLIALGVVAARYPVRAFDLLVPKDAGTGRIAHDVAFADHPRLTLNVYAPTAGTAAAPGDMALPILVYFHGGSWAVGSKDGYSFLGRAFAARGFVTIIPNYRLYPEARYPSFLEDCAEAVAWARAHAAEIGGDPDRIVLVGHSAGGYNAAMLALDERWLEAANVPRAAILAWAGIAGPYDFLPLDVASTQRTFGEAEDLPDTQPINHVDPADPPAILVTGDGDTTVAPRHTMTLAALMLEHGIAAEQRIYDGIGHIGVAAAIARPFRAWAPVLDDVAGFLEEAVEATR